MKKIFLLFMSLFMMASVSMADNKPYSVDTDKVKETLSNKFNFSINYTRLHMCIGLSFSQIESFDYIYNKFEKDMIDASYYENTPEFKNKVSKSVKYNLTYMRYILTDKQYKRYEKLLNTTLNNRGFDFVSFLKNS